MYPSITLSARPPAARAPPPPAPPRGRPAPGAPASGAAARLQRHHGVDLRTGVTVMAMVGDGRLRRAHLSDGDVLDVDVAVVALGAVRNTEWLSGAGRAAGAPGVGCG